MRALRVRLAQPFGNRDGAGMEGISNSVERMERRRANRDRVRHRQLTAKRSPAGGETDDHSVIFDVASHVLPVRRVAWRAARNADRFKGRLMRFSPEGKHSE